MAKRSPSRTPKPSAPAGSSHETGWRCPTCGRRFVRRPHEHSCHVQSLAAHLDRGSPAVRETFEALQATLADIGPHALIAVKTMILIRAGSNFAGLSVKRDALDLEFVHPRPLQHARIRKSQQFGARYSHHVRLSVPGDVNATIAGWLRDSYQLVTCGKTAKS